MNYPGEVITCKGEISQKSTGDGEGMVKLRLWAEKADGEKTVTGQAVVSLPFRS